MDSPPILMPYHIELEQYLFEITILLLTTGTTFYGMHIAFGMILTPEFCTDNLESITEEFKKYPFGRDINPWKYM